MDLVKQLISILAYFFSPRLRRRREKEKMYKELQALQDQYGLAMEEGDPEAAAIIHAKMNEARERIKYLESRDN